MCDGGGCGGGGGSCKCVVVDVKGLWIRIDSVMVCKMWYGFVCV